jgi:drug/metabolite transporter (DMT)-like permease
LAVGGFATAGMLLQNDGLRFTAASTSAFLTNFYAILIPIWVALRRRRLPAFRIWISCILVTAGIAILGRFDWTAWRFGRGEAETLLASGFFMVQILWLEHPAYADNRPMPMTLVMFGVEAVGFGALGLATAPRLSAMLAPWLSPAWVGCTLLLTVGCTLFSFTLMNIWQPKITATEAGLVYCAEPLFGSVLSLFLPALFSVWAAIHYANERVTLNLLWGGGLITAANVLIQLQPRAPAGRCESTAPPAG